MLSRGRSLANLAGDGKALAMATHMDGLNTLLAGRFKESRAILRAAEDEYRDRGCTDIAWELAGLRTTLAVCLHNLGALAELDAFYHPYMAEARARGDLYARVFVGTGYGVLVWLVRDEPGQADAEYRPDDALGPAWFPP